MRLRAHWQWDVSFSFVQFVFGVRNSKYSLWVTQITERKPRNEFMNIRPKEVLMEEIRVIFVSFTIYMSCVSTLCLAVICCSSIMTGDKKNHWKWRKNTNLKTRMFQLTPNLSHSIPPWNCSNALYLLIKLLAASCKWMMRIGLFQQKWKFFFIRWTLYQFQSESYTLPVIYINTIFSNKPFRSRWVQLW